MQKSFLLLLVVSFLLSWPLQGSAQVACKNAHAFDRFSTEIQQFSQNLKSESQEKGWISAHRYFFHQSKIYKEFAANLKEIEKDPHSGIDSPSFNEALKQIIFNPREDLTPAQIRALSANKKLEYVTKTVMYILSTGELASRMMQRFGHYWSGKVDPPQQIKGFLPQIKFLAKSTYNGPIRFMAPFLPLPKYRSSVDKIFEKKYRDPDYELTPSEQQMLQEAGAFEAYGFNAEFRSSHPKWIAVKKWLSRAFVSAMMVNGALLANWSGHLAKPDTLVDSKTFLEDPRYRLAPSQVRIYNESVPFPHMAIEIDGKVYSYGQTHMSIKTSQEYLLSEKIQEVAAGKDAPTKAGSIGLTQAFKATGLDHLSRSVQMVTLNLDPAQKAHLKRQLELSENSRYHNQTLAMDCATMVMRALSMNTDVPVPQTQIIPTVADASPSLVMMYFGMLKSIGYTTKDGRPLVGDIKQVAMDNADNKSLHLWRNLYINAIESRAFLAFLGLDTGVRGYLNLRYGTDHFQYLEPQVKAEIEKWQPDVLRNMTDPQAGGDIVANQYQVFLAKATELGRIPAAMRDPKWQTKFQGLVEVSNYFFDRELESSLAILASNDSAFAEIIRNSYRVEILKQMKLQVAQLAETGEAELQIENPDLTLNRVLKSTSTGNDGP